ncbi:hypothetical protein, conserved [Babesia bigemina]|uniref:Uncharacterized protein n=1 Tax=Babesia bigemina TaxID=5866 RepID=A0A061D8V4_BABBI|nr:hypothetical protein, conserved [Babesia bigemina]CDR97141.1 hypothetical protein, conserved [Babesia bigemina]|eukprot:XP_012769327.1 hypothetical protein, conserved [Babesia bigemina]
MSDGGASNGGSRKSLLQSIRSRLQIPSIKHFPARADAPQRWRTQMGGFDPATPYAEALINYHNHAATFMIFVVLTVIHTIRR